MPVIIGKEPGIAASMSESADAGGSLAWRLLATLEGGSLVLAGCALLAYTARGRPAQQARPPVDTVAITNTTNELGKILKARLEAHGCTVSELTSDATSGAGSRQYDALVVVGGSPKDEDLNGITGLVTEDVYNNIQLLENLSSRVHKGGCIAWACAGAIKSPGSFGNTTDAFDAVLQASLMHVAKVLQCVPVWVGRGASAERAADSLVAALLNAHTQDASWFSVRNAAHTVREYLCRWLKIIT